jgi:hypothetical protein
MNTIIILSVVSIVTALLLAFLVSFPVMFLWNAIMPLVFDLPVITFWQSLGLCIMLRLLFGTGLSSSK